MPQIISVTQSYHDALEIFRKHFGKIFGVVVIPHLLTALLVFSLKISVIASVARLATLKDLLSMKASTSLVIGLLLLVIFVIQMIGWMALTIMVVHHEQLSVRSAFEHALGYFWRFVVLGILLILIIAAGLFLGSVIVLLIGTAVGRISIDFLNQSFDWLVFIIPITSAVVSTYFIFSPFILVEKNTTIAESLKSSFHLIKQCFWPIALRLLLLSCLTFIVGLALQYLDRIGDLLFLLIVSPFSVVYLYVLYSHLHTAQQ